MKLILVQDPVNRITFNELRNHLGMIYFQNKTLANAYRSFKKRVDESEGDYQNIHKTIENTNQKIRDDDYLNDLNEQIAVLLKDIDKKPKKLFNMPKRHDKSKQKKGD